MLYNVGMPDAPRIQPVPADGFTNMGIQAPQTLQAFLAGKKMDEELAQREALAGLVEARLNPAPAPAPVSAMPLNKFAGVTPAPVAPTVPAQQQPAEPNVDPQVEAAIAANPQLLPTVRLYSAMADITGGMEGGIQILTNAGYSPETAAHIVAKETAPHYIEAVKGLHAQGVIGDKDLNTFHPAIDLAQLNQKTSAAIRVIAKQNPMLALTLIDKYSDEAKKSAMNNQVAAIMGNPNLDQVTRIRALEQTAIQYGASDISTILNSEKALMQDAQMTRKLTAQEKRDEETARQNQERNVQSARMFQLQSDKFEQLGKHQSAMEAAAMANAANGGAHFKTFETADGKVAVSAFYPNGKTQTWTMPSGFVLPQKESGNEEKRNQNAEDIKALPPDMKLKLAEIVTGKSVLVPENMKIWQKKFANSGLPVSDLYSHTVPANTNGLTTGKKVYNPATGRIE